MLDGIPSSDLKVSVRVVVVVVGKHDSREDIIRLDDDDVLERISLVSQHIKNGRAGFIEGLIHLVAFFHQQLVIEHLTKFISELHDLVVDRVVVRVSSSPSGEETSFDVATSVLTPTI